MARLSSLTIPIPKRIHPEGFMAPFYSGKDVVRE